MKTKPENVFDAMVRNLMAPQKDGGCGCDEKSALAIAARALKEMEEDPE